MEKTKPLDIDGGVVRVYPLAFESFGVRGMATYIETDDVKIVADPGSALGPRFGLLPHELEYIALARSKDRILDFCRRADVLTISHYHFDHFIPFFENWTWIWCSDELAERAYRGKLVLAKDPTSHINVSQRRRGYLFWKRCTQVADLQIADGRAFKFGDTILRFSKPVPHGPRGSNIGLVVMLEVRVGKTSVVHASDVQGPIERETLQWLVKEKPSAVLVGGPPLYLKGFRIEEEALELARQNMIELAKHVRTIIIDHHLLRSTEYVEFLQPVVAQSKKAGHQIFTASEAIGKKPELLEARRRELHAEKPMKREWYKQLESGGIEL